LKEAEEKAKKKKPVRKITDKKVSPMIDVKSNLNI
jgi:hypothetical protein